MSSRNEDTGRDERLTEALAAFEGIVLLYRDKVTDQNLHLYALVRAATELLGRAVTEQE